MTHRRPIAKQRPTPTWASAALPALGALGGNWRHDEGVGCEEHAAKMRLWRPSLGGATLLVAIFLIEWRESMHNLSSFIYLASEIRGAKVTALVNNTIMGNVGGGGIHEGGRTDYSSSPNVAPSKAGNSGKSRDLALPSTLLNVSRNHENRARVVHPICVRNPYMAALADDAETIAARMDLLLNDTQLQSAHQEAQTNQELLTKWNRFVFGFPALSRCREEENVCLGGPCGSDESKITCGARYLNHSCVVYSIGGNNQWQFEQDVLAHTNCEVHTFDCTGSIDRFDGQPTGVNFHHVCLGTNNLEAPSNCTGKGKCGETWTLEKIQSQLQHDRIDLLKADIEGYEWSLLESWWDQHQLEQNDSSGKVVVLPNQIMMEVHYKTQFGELRPPWNKSSTRL
jgi:Methyltransferase domain